jgi:hypothetical protein
VVVESEFSDHLWLRFSLGQAKQYPNAHIQEQRQIIQISPSCGHSSYKL